MIAQIVQVLGSLLILAAFAASQRRLLAQDSLAYLALNFVGSAVLATLAARESQFGFLLLEGCWAIISAFGLLQQLRRGRA